MKATTSALGLLASALYSVNAAYVATIDIGSCMDLVTAADSTSGGDIRGNLIGAEITCDDWTTITINQNKLKLVGMGTKFDRIRFEVASGAVLRSDVPVEFTGGATSQGLDGGFLHVTSGGRARFLDSVAMHDAAVMTESEESVVNGGCIYNEGVIRFEAAFTAEGCKAVSFDPSSVSPGAGGALWNGLDGKVVFKGTVAMNNNGETSGLEGWTVRDADGGAIYSEGKVSFFQDATFTDNEGGRGGAIYIGPEGVVKFLKRAEAVFDGNTSRRSGGHISVDGSLVLRNTGMFTNGVAGGSGGAIDCGDFSEMLFIKHQDFLDNTAGAHGGAIATQYTLIQYLPEDATYEGNSRTNADRDYECNNVYANGSADGGEDGYTCIPGGAGSSYSV